MSLILRSSAYGIEVKPLVCRGCKIKLLSFSPEFIDKKLPNFQYKKILLRGRVLLPKGEASLAYISIKGLTHSGGVYSKHQH